MNVEAVNLPNAGQFQLNKGSDQVRDARKQVKEQPQSDQPEKKQIQPEELLSQIKALTEDGLYSVRFENDSEAGEMVVKVVDRDTDEVIRQIPPEELRELAEQLKGLRGNLVDTQS
ncbi:flagellar protein FlaG [Desulfopila inferna]|uniref:flagellar protein FlaG n=1 Tax=Desulfopila inferna TaxID=468528 RepID=UPI00196494FC|nr:flagellar protein FlaG [Desulfopila inferna]MBM9603009.1 flagellar protein FlaG [Desulfopila inferna]